MAANVGELLGLGGFTFVLGLVAWRSWRIQNRLMKGALSLGLSSYGLSA